MTKRICIVDGCDRPHSARGWCRSHYGQWRHLGEIRPGPIAVRVSSHPERPCAVCGEAFVPTRSDNLYCSPKCCDLRNSRRCSECGELVWKPGSEPCRSCRDIAADVPHAGAFLRAKRALHDRPEDAWAILEPDLMARVEVVESGCWEWLGAFNRGYPRISVTGAHILVHRLVLQAFTAKRLDLATHAHHKCANTKCVSPHHLQAVTHQQNLAEMLARHAYLNRIDELERALAEIDPTHPCLTA